MGCCSGRFNKPLDSNLTKNPNVEIIDKNYFSSLHSNYLSNKQNFYKKTFNISSGENKKLNEELEELSQARDLISLEKLSNLLTSTTPVTMDPDAVLHTWADNPRSIGSLSAIQIGIFASDKEITSSSNFFTDIIRFKILEKLLIFIKSSERDQFESAMLALSFLTENCAEIVEIIVKKNIMGIIVKFMKDRKEGLRATAALCCRNLYVGRPSVQKGFIREGGAEMLIGLLDSDDSVTVFETILNLLDLLLDADDVIQPDIKKQLVCLGVCNQLQRILSQESRYDQDTIREAEKLLQLFE